MTEAEKKHMDELWKEYTKELDEKRDTMIAKIKAMGADELELMWEKFTEFEIDLFINGGAVA